MTFSGTLIEDLMATVERVEKRADRALVVEPAGVEPWITSHPENSDYDSKFLGVA
jgi:hypothetical protein